MTTFTLKSGTNKGNRRMWIEGQRLLDAGLTRCTGLFRTMNSDGTLTLSTRPTDGAKNHRVAGTVARPIIDMSGKWVTAFIGNHTHFATTVLQTGDYITLTIEPTNA